MSKREIIGLVEQHGSTALPTKGSVQAVCVEVPQSMCLSASFVGRTEEPCRSTRDPSPAKKVACCSA